VDIVIERTGSCPRRRLRDWLLIIDEEQRFGVSHKEKSNTSSQRRRPDLTATAIPGR